MKNRDTAILVAIVAALSSGAAFAQGSNEGGGPGGFFGRGDGGGGMGFRRGGRMGGGEMHGMRGVHELKSLTPDQKQKIKKIMQDMRTEMRGLMASSTAAGGPDAGKTQSEGISITDAKGETKDFGGPGGGRGFGGRGGWQKMDPQARQKMKQVRSDAWAKMKAVLTPDQLAELTAMRQGQMMPRGGGGGGDLMPTTKAAPAETTAPDKPSAAKPASKDSTKSKKAAAK